MNEVVTIVVNNLLEIVFAVLGASLPRWLSRG